MNWGSTSDSIGTISPARISRASAPLPLNRRWASPKAISEQTSTHSTTEMAEIRKLLRYHQPIELAWKAL